MDTASATDTDNREDLRLGDKVSFLYDGIQKVTGTIADIRGARAYVELDTPILVEKDRMTTRWFLFFFVRTGSVVTDQVKSKEVPLSFLTKV